MSVDILNKNAGYTELPLLPFLANQVISSMGLRAYWLSAHFTLALGCAASKILNH